MNRSTVINYSDSDIATARTTLEQARESEVAPIVILTDEEITILDGLQHDQLVPMPWLDQQSEDPEVLSRVALRSMLARELVRPVESDTGITIQAHPGITGPLVLRRTAQAFVTLERTTAEGKHWLFAYLHDHEGTAIVLEEEITAAGHHAFSVYPVEVLGSRLQPLLDPYRSATGQGSMRTLSAAEIETQASRIPELRDAEAVIALSGIPAEHDLITNITVYAGRNGVHVLRGTEHHPDAAPVEYTLSAASTQDLQRIHEELIV